MRNLEISKKILDLGDDSKCTIVYYVTIDDLSDSVTGVLLESYGVGVSVCESGESETLRCITQNSSAIISLACLMAKNDVTPVTAADIVRDWLG